MDAYLYGLIRELTDESRAHLARDEKFSAGIVGAFYAMNAYRSQYGNQYMFLRECVADAIDAEVKKRNSKYRIESNYSLDMRFGDSDNDGVDGKSFLRSNDEPVEEQVNMNVFLDFLQSHEKPVAKLFCEGATVKDAQDMLHMSEEQMISTIYGIQKKYIEYYNTFGKLYNSEIVK